MGFKHGALDLIHWKAAPSLDGRYHYMFWILFLDIIKNVPWRFNHNVSVSCSKARWRQVNIFRKNRTVVIIWIWWGSNPVHWSCFIGEKRPLWTAAATTRPFDYFTGSDPCIWKKIGNCFELYIKHVKDFFISHKWRRNIWGPKSL